MQVLRDRTAQQLGELGEVTTAGSGDQQQQLTAQQLAEQCKETAGKVKEARQAGEKLAHDAAAAAAAVTAQRAALQALQQRASEQSQLAAVKLMEQQKQSR